MNRRPLVLACLALAVMLPCSTAAGVDSRQFTIGLGAHPTVVVKDDEVFGARTTWVHVAWATTAGFPEGERVLNAIGYCRLRLFGGRTCQDRQVLLPLGRFGAGAAPELWVTDDGALVITDSRGPEPVDQGRWMLISRDEGLTWTVFHTSHLERGNSGLLSRARHLEVINPADGSLATVGSSFFSFGLPVFVARIDRTAIAPPPESAPGFPDFANDGVRRVYAEVLGRLPDGRLFAVGHVESQPGNNVYVRVQVPGGDPNSPSTGWTPWQPLPLAGALWGVGYSPGVGPTALLHRPGPQYTSVQVVSFDGQTLGRRRMIGGDVSLAANSIGTDLNATRDGVMHATWYSHNEGCRRGTRCLLYLRLDRRLTPGPKWIVRAVPNNETQPVLEFPAATGYGPFGLVAWQERSPNIDGLPTIKLAQIGEAHRGYLSGRRNQAFATLTAPNLVTSRSFAVRVTAGLPIKRVAFTLLPPFCRPRTTGDQCFALRRPVTRTRLRAPFVATFGGLPVARTISTSDPLKNRHCAADAYLYRLRARVATSVKTVVLERNVSVCPIVR